MSIILGILVSALPNYLAKQVYFQFGGRSPQQILKYFYTSLLCKYFVTALLAVPLLLWADLNVAQFCIGMILAEFARWAFLLFSLGVFSLGTKFT